MTPRWTLSIVAALTLGASVPADAATIRITMENLVISPAETSATVGDTIELINKDVFAHTATARNGDFDVTMPPNKTTFADGGHALRSVHAKTHGILQGYLEVDTDLPGDLAQGLFAKPGRYPVVMRFSTVPGDILDDSVSTPRGLAIKVIGVEGERLEGSEGDVTQDFVLINGPAFGAPNPKKFLSVMRLFARTTDKAQRFKKILSAVMRQVQKAIVVVTGHPNTTVATLGGQPETHILGETFYSQAPLRFGDFIAKISVAPKSPELKALAQASLNVNGVPNGLREAVLDFFGKNGGVWEVRAQLCTDLEHMPIENAAVVWSEEVSPYQRS